MRFFRQLIIDATCGGPLVALVGVLMALQALIGGFGNGAMAMASVQPIVICSAAATDHGQHKAPADTHGVDCFLTACQVAGSVHAGIPGKAPVFAATIAVALTAGFIAGDIGLAPRDRVRSGEARGPPSYPV